MKFVKSADNDADTFTKNIKNKDFSRHTVPSESLYVAHPSIWKTQIVVTKKKHQAMSKRTERMSKVCSITILEGPEIIESYLFYVNEKSKHQRKTN